LTVGYATRDVSDRREPHPAALIVQTLMSDIFWSVVLVIECASIGLFLEFGYLTLRSFIAPDAVRYNHHFVLMAVTTALFFLLKILAISLWHPA
jgi:hypothetical protein